MKPIVLLKKEDKSEVDSSLSQWYVCSVCQKIFNSESLLRNHSFGCSEKKPFVYEVCHMGFTGENQLIQHQEECHGIDNCYSGCATDIFYASG